MCPTRHFVYIFFNPVFQVSTAKNEINLFNNPVLIVAPVTFAPAGAMTPSAEFLSLQGMIVSLIVLADCLDFVSRPADKQEAPCEWSLFDIMLILRF